MVGAGLLGAWIGGGLGGSRALYGALLGGVGAGIAYAVGRRLVLGLVGDTFAPSMALGIAVGRVGCFLEGCCAGTPSGLPWAVEGRHPAQLYESLGAFALAGLVVAARRRREVPGEAFLAFGVGYGVLRFGLEFLRANHAPLALGLTGHQWFAAASAAACVALWVARRRLYAPAPAGL